jgi:Glycosyl hydrolases family 16
MGTARLAAMSDRRVRPGHELEFEDTFDGERLDDRRWVAHYLPQWSTGELSAARYQVGGGGLQLLIEADQPPWCPDLDGDIRVSSRQTGVYAGPLGSGIGQHRFNPDATVREPQPSLRLYTPRYGVFEIRAKALDDPQNMVAFWMIGYEDHPEHSAEICVCEIFGRDVERHQAKVGMGVHPFSDPGIVDEFAAETVPIDACDFHVYTAEWTPDRIDFFIDDEHIKTVNQSPGYPMQLMISIYEFPRAGGEPSATPYPKRFVVDYVRGFRRSS